MRIIRIGSRVLAELLGRLLGGAVIGWVIDYFAGTSPWGLLVMLFLGIIVAFRNIIRISNRRSTDPWRASRVVRYLGRKTASVAADRQDRSDAPVHDRADVRRDLGRSRAIISPSPIRRCGWRSRRGAVGVHAGRHEARSWCRAAGRWRSRSSPASSTTCSTPISARPGANTCRRSSRCSCSSCSPTCSACCRSG